MSLGAAPSVDAAASSRQSGLLESFSPTEADGSFSVNASQLDPSASFSAYRREPVAAGPMSRCCPRMCPCGEVERQLGLVALDASDALLVWLRFISLVLGVVSFFYLVLVWRFSKWWPAPGITALLVLCLLHTFATFMLGWAASRRHAHRMQASDASFSEDAGAAALPEHPRLLLAAKWCSAAPLSLLSAFLGAFLGAALAGWLDFKTDGPLSSTQRFMTVLLLITVSLVSLAAQCFLFLVASAMQKGGSSSGSAAADDDDEVDLSWQQMHEQTVHIDGRAGVQTVDAGEDDARL